MVGHHSVLYRQKGLITSKNETTAKNYPEFACIQCYSVIKTGRAVNPASLQILRIDMEGMIDDVKMNMTSLVMTSYEVIYAKILVEPY